MTNHERRRCNAKNRFGEPCQLAPIKGAMVCRSHGGSAPQVKKAAAERLLELVDPAITRIRALIDNADSDSVKLAASKDALDRTGHKPTEKTESKHEVIVREVDDWRGGGDERS